MQKNEIATENRLGWRVHTAGLIAEILTNQTTGILKMPLAIFQQLLAQVGLRAAELNDPKLNELMTRLTIYPFADPKDKDHDPDLVNKILQTNQPIKKGIV